MAKRRHRGGRYQLISADGAGSLIKVLRHISREDGERLLARGKVYAVADRDGVTIGFQLKQHARMQAPEPKPKRDPRKVDVTVIATAQVLTLAEMQAAMGLYGRSRTAGMSEERRAERVKGGEDAEDFVERAAMKVGCYAVAS